MIVQSGQTTACYDADFDPFGGEHIVTNTCPQNYKFTGKERDTETNLDDFEARYYSSQFGRFHSADWSAIPVPVPYADLGNPQTLNLYAYVKNNPLNLTDPTGHVVKGAVSSSEGMYIVPAFGANPLSRDGSDLALYDTKLLTPNGETVEEQQPAAQTLILVGDPGLGEHNQGRNFDRAAQTRAEELEKQGVSVTVVRVSSVDDVASALKNNGTLKGVEYFGHASYDRLYVGETSARGTNINGSNVGKLSGANLTPHATVAIHACFAGSGGSDSIASKISHQLGRTVTAYDGPTIFSSNPSRPGGGRYPPSSGPLYLVPDRGTKLITFP